MDKSTYKRYLQTEHWKKLRFEVLKRSGGRCERCGYRPWKRGVLQVHHKTYLYRVTTQLAFVPGYQLQMIIKIKKFREDYEKKYGHKPDNGLVMHEFFISGDCLHELDVLKDLKELR